MNAEMPLRARGAIRHRHRDHDLTDAAVRRELLRSVQHPAGAGACGAGAHAGRIGSGGRLGQPPRADLLAARQRHEKRPLLLLGAEHQDVRGAQAVVRRDRQRQRRDRRAPVPRYRCSSRRRRCRRRRTRPGIWMPSRPRSASAGTTSAGKCWASSHSRTCGRISVSANSRTLLRSSSCSSLSRKSISGHSPALLLPSGGCMKLTRAAIAASCLHCWADTGLRRSDRIRRREHDPGEPLRPRRLRGCRFLLVVGDGRRVATRIGDNRAGQDVKAARPSRREPRPPDAGPRGQPARKPQLGREQHQVWCYASAVKGGNEFVSCRRGREDQGAGVRSRATRRVARARRPAQVHGDSLPFTTFSTSTTSRRSSSRSALAAAAAPGGGAVADAPGGAPGATTAAATAARSPTTPARDRRAAGGAGGQAGQGRQGGGQVASAAAVAVVASRARRPPGAPQLRAVADMRWEALIQNYNIYVRPVAASRRRSSQASC